MGPRHAHGDLTSLAPHERLPEILVVPRPLPPGPASAPWVLLCSLQHSYEDLFCWAEHMAIRRQIPLAWNLLHRTTQLLLTPLLSLHQIFREHFLGQASSGNSPHGAYAAGLPDFTDSHLPEDGSPDA